MHIFGHLMRFIVLLISWIKQWSADADSFHIGTMAKNKGSQPIKWMKADYAVL